MRVKVYGIFDAKTEAYMQPFFAQSAGAAIRQFQMHANDPQTMVGRFPADFTLFELGTFDDQTGILEPLKAHTPLGKAIEYVKSDSVVPLDAASRK